MICQHFFMKHPLNPSGPGAWSEAIPLTATSISSLKKGSSKTGSWTSWMRVLWSYERPIYSETPNLSLNEDQRAPTLRECSETTEPSDNVKLAIKFLLKDKIVMAWKSFVFSSSLNFTRLIVDLCLLVCFDSRIQFGLLIRLELVFIN